VSSSSAFCFCTSRSSVSALTVYTFTVDLFLTTFTAIFLDSARVVLVAARAAVSSVLLSTVGLGARGLGGGEGGGFQRSAVYGGIHLLVHLHVVLLGLGVRVLGDGGGELLVVGVEGDGGGELLVVGSEGGELLVNFVFDTSFTSLHFRVHN
jgi:hypothetical protein